MRYSIYLARPTMSWWRHVAIAGCIAVLGACGSDHLNLPTESGSEVPATELSGTRPAVPSFAGTSLQPGIPFGFWRLEYSQLGSDWTSLKKTGSPVSIRRDLDLARSRGGRVFVQLAGGVKNYMTDGKFDLAKFKKMLDLYKGVDLDSYIDDGTLAGHMMIDEPSDASNWGGRPIPYSTLDAAAQHSKLLWPNLPTLVRSKPTWLAQYRWEYLDGGWAQYAARLGDVARYRDVETKAAQDAGLKVVWGLNVLNGGDGTSGKIGTKPGSYRMTPTELLRYGKVLIEAAGSCGFLMWMYDNDYMSSSGVHTSMKTLSQAAAARAPQSCGHAASGSTDGETGGTTSPVSSPSSIVLKVAGRVDATKQYMMLTWTGARAATVDVYRNGVFWKNQLNDGRYTNSRYLPGSSRYTYRVCEVGTTTCSNEATVVFW